MDKIKIKRALISVSDKTGIDEFAQVLSSMGCEIISTGGTKKVLEEAGIDVVDISKVTGNPEAFGGRMKTISFQIESALLYDREKDADEAEKLGIRPIDMVICNLYPFGKVKDEGADLGTLVENIDIGGPTMLRAAAKNYKYVTVITDPYDYQRVEDELAENDDQISLDTRFYLMRKVFNHTADYDALIASTMDETAGELTPRFAFNQAKELRYGENGHQTAFFLREKKAKDSLFDMEVLHGKELSFNNIVDMYGAIESVRDLQNNGVAVIKHTNPCGLCEGPDQRKAFELAWAGDTVSAFGSVIAFNAPVGLEAAQFLNLDAENKMERKFVEVMIAPDFSEEALEYLYQHKNLRVVKFDPQRLTPAVDIKILFNTALYQTTDNKLLNKVEYVTEKKADIPYDLARFGLIAVRQLKSNAIAVARKNGEYNQLLGMGCGQPNRVNSTQLALKKCYENLDMEFSGVEAEKEKYFADEMAKAVLTSDAFFPFADNIDFCNEYGIKTILQPGGSIRDKSVIKRCDELGMAMAFTAVRHFKH